MSLSTVNLSLTIMPQHNRPGGNMNVGVRDAAGRYIETFDIMVQLPWGALTSVVVHHDMTVQELKSVIEFAVGIPSDVVTIGYKRFAALADHPTLRELKIIPGDRITVTIEYGFQDVVAGAISGNTQAVVNDINKHWDEGDVARRRMVAMFISCHRGYHYLVERMLTDGGRLDGTTPSGRTALHIACAMGNGGCIDALLQRGANTMIKDNNNKTPAQVAFSCGQQESERRLVLYERARSRQTRKISKREDWLRTLPNNNNTSSSWSRSPRFPVSRLARSVTPTLALQELSLSPAPGPELHVKSIRGAVKANKVAKDWFVRRLTQADLGQFSQSSDSSDAESDSVVMEDEAPQLNADRENEVSMLITPDTSRLASNGPEDTVSAITSQSMTSSSRSPMSTSATSPAIRPPHLLPTRTTAWQQDARKVRFEDSPRGARPSPPKGTSALVPKSLGSESALRGHESPKVGAAYKSFASNTRQGSSPEQRHVKLSNNDQQETFALGTTSPTYQKGMASVHGLTTPRSSTTTPRSANTSRVSSARTRSPRFSPRYPDDRYGRDEILAMKRVKDIQAAMELSVGLRETTEQPFLSNGRQKATPEENFEAFENWLESKVQGAKDRKLLDNVQQLLDEAFGRADEEIKRQEEKRPKRSGQSYEAWRKQKADEAKNRKKEVLEKEKKEENARKLRASEDAENELLIKAWILRKNEMERRQKASEVKEKRENHRRMSVQQQAAQNAFLKWRLGKEWEELERLREGEEFFDSTMKIGKANAKVPAKKRIKSAPSLRGGTRSTRTYRS